MANNVVENKRIQSGFNEVAHEKSPAWFIQFAQSFSTPFNGVLFFIASISFVMDVFLAKPGDKDFKTVAVVIVMVLFSSFLRVWQEFRSNKAAEQLKNMVKTTATVLRTGTGRQELEIKQLVPGDIVFLSAGDMVPADCRMLQAKVLFIS